MKSLQSPSLKTNVAILLLFQVLGSFSSSAQTQNRKKQVLVDIGHGQKFYNDPNETKVSDPSVLQRVKYMTGELANNAAVLDAEMRFQKGKISKESLENCDLLFIHMPSSKYDVEELKAIQQYLRKGGSMFIVMEVDYWSTLDKTNVNDIVQPFGISYKNDNPDGKSSGGYTETGPVAKKSFSIPYHGARIVEGGTPFCFSNQTKDYPFGVYKKLDGGGKIIAMGEGMVSLYMTSWEGVTNYQCSEFMHDVFAWLLK